MTQRNFNRLRAAMDDGNAKWLEGRYPEIADAVRLEIEDGATAEEVETFAHKLGGDQDWLARKIASAARHIATVVEKRR